ncbi:MAG: histidinol-phosphatase HisJ family protein [Candidatus Bathyarchaeota archaeon]|nr:histidinol-phosphatase HisJ family protein [Candidatus Bathyarchaeota archaeon]
MPADYHIHTEASLDAKGSMEEYIRKAKQKKLGEIGFSEHIILHNIEGHPYTPYTPIKSSYLQNFLNLKANAELFVKLGAEVDFIPKVTEKIGIFLREFPFDYVIGAVHFIDNWSVDSPSQMHEYSKRNVLKVYEEYFSLVKRLCRSRLFDILAHPDLIKIFGFKPKTDFSHILGEAAETMAKYNVCAEINTSGLRRPCQEIYPSEQFLKILHSHNVAVVFGSDAHEPNDVGRNFTQAVKLAKKVGYTKTCVFNQRRRDFVKI